MIELGVFAFLYTYIIVKNIAEATPMSKIIAYENLAVCPLMS